MRKIIYPVAFFIILLAFYGATFKTIPVSYWDELIWVGRSYFFQLYIRGDFTNPIWESYESFDQPKLAEFAFGAWLYPVYLREAKNQKQPYDFMQFLSHYHLLLLNTGGGTQRIFKAGDEGPPSFWTAKYGNEGLAVVHLIYYARTLSVILLAAGAVIGYVFVLTTVGFVPAIIFSVFYSFNPLLIQTGLKAESQALFLVTFNAAMLLMALYFSKRRKVLYLLLFSIFSGFCLSTKLNGAMLVIMFFVINTTDFFISKHRKRRRLFLGIVPVAVSFIILIALNPFTYPDPIGKTKYLFDWRMKFASGYQVTANKQTALPNAGARLGAIFSNFYSPQHAGYYNGSTLLQAIPWQPYYPVILGLLSLVGFLYLVKLFFKNNRSANIIIASFVIILACMCGYLVLNWDRYYVQLVLFFVLFQSVGLYVTVRRLLRMFVMK